MLFLILIRISNDFILILILMLIRRLLLLEFLGHLANLLLLHRHLVDDLQLNFLGHRLILVGDCQFYSFIADVRIPKGLENGGCFEDGLALLLVFAQQLLPGCLDMDVANNDAIKKLSNPISINAIQNGPEYPFIGLDNGAVVNSTTVTKIVPVLHGRCPEYVHAPFQDMGGEVKVVAWPYFPLVGPQISLSKEPKVLLDQVFQILKVLREPILVAFLGIMSVNPA